MKEETFYQIRNTQTGAFSTGGSYPGWSAQGKRWKSRGSINRHLAIVPEARRNLMYAQAEVVRITRTIYDSTGHMGPVINA